METNSLVGGAVQMAGNAANSVGRKIAPAVRFMATTFSSPSSAALLSLANAATLSVATALSSPAGAAELNHMPVASQVASIKVEVTKATLQGLKIDPDSLADFDRLSAANQGKVLFFLDGLKKAQKFPDTAAEKLPSLKEAAEKLIFLLGNHQTNLASCDTMKKTAGALAEVLSVKKLITQLSDPQTYGAVLASVDSPYGQRFSQEKQAMMATYTEAAKLQDVAKNMESPELVAARQKLAANKAKAAAAEQQLAEHQAELERNRATNAALGRVVSSFR